MSGIMTLRAIMIAKEVNIYQSIFIDNMLMFIVFIPRKVIFYG